MRIGDSAKTPICQILSTVSRSGSPLICGNWEESRVEPQKERLPLCIAQKILLLRAM